MSHDLSYIHSFRSVMRDNHNTEVIACHIENDKWQHVISRIEDLLDMVEVAKVGVLNNRMPLTQNTFCRKVLLPELTKYLDRDNVHSQIISF